jgi:hypothetical protein
VIRTGLGVPPRSDHGEVAALTEAEASAQQVELLRLIEHRVGREIDVAAACGLGRRPDVSQARDAMESALLLVQAGE